VSGRERELARIDRFLAAAPAGVSFVGGRRTEGGEAPPLGLGGGAGALVVAAGADGEAEAWIRSRAGPVVAIEIVHERPWATVARAGGKPGRVAQVLRPVYLPMFKLLTLIR
jgi:hypothetical protein